MPDHRQEVHLLRQINTYLNFAEVGKVLLALHISSGAHFRQTRDDGVTAYFSHPLAVACFLADEEHDAVTIMAALLHDVVEDTSYTLEQIRHNFGDEVAFIVDGVTKFGCCKTCTIDKIRTATDADKRVLIVKLADRIHNLQTLSGMKSLNKQAEKLEETRAVYLPLAQAYQLDGLAAVIEHLVDTQEQRLEREVVHDGKQGEQGAKCP